MKKPEIYLETPINDIVFEDRNQAYGAYQLRKDSSRFLSLALMFGIIISSAVTAFSLTHKKPAINDISIITPYKPSIIPEKEIPEIKELLPEPPQPETIKQAQDVFKEMRASNDNSKTDDAPTIKSLDNKLIGNEKIISDSTGEVPIIKNTLKDPAVKKDDFLVWAGQMPEFVGGFMAMQNWLGKHISYPEFAVRNNVQGKVFVSFIVNTDGTISDANVVTGIGYGCDEEAVDAVNEMPNWMPGKQNSIPVRVKVTIPIKFELEEN
ncbi:MAG: TonB family protein [Chitinophagales bacterium]